MIGMINYKNISNGNSILYIESNGVHHHGFSLIGRLLDEFPEIKKEFVQGISFMDEIMKPPYCYYGCLKPLIENKKVNGLVNIAGFGIPRSVERIVPDGLSAYIVIRPTVNISQRSLYYQGDLGHMPGANSREGRPFQGIPSVITH